MNTKRTKFVQLPSHKINVTPYWLLGLIEGEGCFSVEKARVVHKFILGLTISEKLVIEETAKFLKTLIPNESVDLKNLENIISESLKTPSPAEINTKPSAVISIARTSYIKDVFIPFLSNLTFFTKKELDFKDWVFIFNMKLEGKHQTVEGKKAILQICNRMNNYRLTTYVKK
jgi:hypothetical protein